MVSVRKPINQSGDSKELAQKIMVHGFICFESSCALSLEVRRGMTILSKEELEVGQVAAVVLDGNTQKATHILLGRLPETRGYWMVPVDLISEVRDDIVLLGISADVMDKLPLWRSED